MLSELRIDELKMLAANYIYRNDKDGMIDFCNGLTKEELIQVKVFISEFIKFTEQLIKNKGK